MSLPVGASQQAVFTTALMYVILHINLCKVVRCIYWSSIFFVCAAEPPVLQMLSHVITGEFSLPLDSDVNSATDETAVTLIELLSLPVLMKYSVTAPIVAQ